MNCRKCGKEIDNNAKYCINCGVKINLEEKDSYNEITEYKKDDIKDLKIENTDIAIENVEKNNSDNNSIISKCPSCGSDHVQKLSLVYLNGIGNMKGTTIGIGLGGVYGGLVGGTTQTALSQIASPPKKKWVIRRFLIIFTIMNAYFNFELFRSINTGVQGLYWSYVLLMLVCFIVPIFYAIRGFFFNKNIYPTIYYLWDKKFLCLKCSNWFYLESEKDKLLNEEKNVNDKIKKWKIQGIFFIIGIIIVLAILAVVPEIDKKISGYWSSDGKYYYNAEGRMESDKLITYHGDKYYILTNGSKLVKGWQDINNELYYFNSKGIMLKNKWIKYEGSRFHVGKDGKMDRNKWIGDQYVGIDGKMLVNTITPDGKRVGEDGRIIK